MGQDSLMRTPSRVVWLFSAFGYPLEMSFGEALGGRLDGLQGVLESY